MAPRNKIPLLRIGVLIIVGLAVIKFAYKSRPTHTIVASLRIEEKSAKESKDNFFWGKAGEPQENSDKRELPPEPPNEMNAPVDENLPLKKKGVAKDFSGIQLRLVHLDLKGAAPKVSYLEQIFPLLSKMGANGLLIEYEDMFPYSGELEILKSPYAYSKEDIEKILHLAEINKLEVVPLVQTFGHMEYVLKHENYRSLREVEQYPNSINPHRAETMPLVKKILGQVLELHPMASFVHIGADEVFHLGEGQDSKTWLNSNNGDLGKMFLAHVKELLNFLHSHYPDKYALMWDDMLRKLSVENIKDANISKSVSPVLWIYDQNLNTQQTDKLIGKYQDCGFPSVWFASAFKGASGPDQMWTPIGLHMNNHLQWKQVIDSMHKFPKIRYGGIAMTGWQRYDHYSVLCELLPVALPSLVVCLRAIQHGPLTEESKTEINQILGFSKMDLKKNICDGNGAFPGAEIYRMVRIINDDLKKKVREIMEGDSEIRAWFSRYHRKHRFGNPHKMETFRDKVLKTHEEWETLTDSLRVQLETIYFPDTVEEWMEENVNLHLDALRKMAKDFKEILELKAQPKAVLKK
ncbi:hexosaminidase D isoform X2 [Xenopus laevis]|nr:hexosaminidase D isoform X2 [Xenopus laevis]